MRLLDDITSVFDDDELAEMQAEVASIDDRSDDQIDFLIANALNQLSLDEREKVYHEMHGVDEIVKETPEFVESCLNQFDTELQILKNSHHKALAYNMAEEMSRDYVCDQVLRMKFLRSEKFDVPKAAERMIRFFDCKLHFFGQEKLCRDITLQDLDKEDLKALKAGFMQILPVRDRAGRPVFLAVPYKQTYKTPMNKYRALFYLCMTLIEDVETQKRGITAIIYNVAKFERDKYDTNAVQHTAWIQNSVPMKLCSVHYCIGDSGFRYIINIAMHFFSEDARARVKVHFGTHIECSYALMTFGCPVHILPLGMDGQLKRKSHLEFIRMRYQQESRAGLPRIVVPTHYDVLFGRGKPFRQHAANIKLHALMEQEMKQAASSSLKCKTIFTIEKLMDAIRHEGGRFLQQDDVGCWVELDEKAVQEKVGRSFRTRVRNASSQRQ